MTVQQWIAAYAEAWRERDADAAAALFTADSSYRSHPLQEAHLGSDGVHSSSSASDVRITSACSASRAGEETTEAPRAASASAFAGVRLLTTSG